MLPEQLRLLIAAHAGGDLSPRRQRAAVRLLQHSAEARNLLRQLQNDATRLRSLPSVPVPDGLADQVIARLPPAKIAVTVPLPAGRSDPMRARLSRIVSAAAVVSAAASIGLFWYLTRPVEEERPGPSVAQRAAATTRPQIPPAADLTARATDVASEPVEPSPAAVATAPEPARPGDPSPALPTSPPPDVLTAPSRASLQPIEVVPGRLSVPFSLRGLSGEEPFVRLKQELSRDAGHRADLFCREPWRLSERLTACCRDLGLRLIVDAHAQEGQRRRVRQQYLLFSDDLTADEWAVLFHNLGHADRRAEEKIPGDGVFDHLVIAALTPADHKELLNHVGADLLAPPTRPAPAGMGIDVRRPVSSSTADRVVEVLEKNEPKVATKAVPRTVLMISHHPLRSAPLASKEVQAYLDNRPAQKTGNVALMVVVKLSVN